MTDNELRTLLEASSTETRHHFDVAVEGMRADVQTVATATRRHFDVAVEGMRADVQTVATEMRRHFDVAVEGVRADVQIVAEGLGGLQQSIDRQFAGVKGEFEETRSLIKLSYSQLDRRIEVLEHRHALLVEKIDRLEAH